MGSEELTEQIIADLRMKMFAVLTDAWRYRWAYGNRSSVTVHMCTPLNEPVRLEAPSHKIYTPKTSQHNTNHVRP